MRKTLSPLLLLLLCLPLQVQATITAGVSVSDLNNPYFVTMVRTIRDEMTAVFGRDTRLLVRSSAYDHPRQVRHLKEFEAEAVDMIFVVASDEHKIGPTVKQVVKDGTPVFAIDVRADGATATVTTDNIQAGRIACEGLAKAIGGKGNVVIINGPQVSSVIERVQGCKSALGKYPALSMVDDSLNGTASVEGGLETMAYALQVYDDIAGVFTINDRTALGAEQALLQANSPALIVSVDGSPAAKLALSESRRHWLGSATQFPDKMSRKAVHIAAKWLETGKVDSVNVLIPTKLMTAENVKDSSGW